MLYLTLRKGLYKVIERQWSCHLRSASSIPVKTARKNETTTDDDLSNIQSVAVPVQAPPTIDASKRSTSIVPAAITTQPIEEKSQKKKAERLPWMITPYPEDGKLLQHYMKLSKFRLTSMVVITSMAGYAMAPAPFDPTTFILCSVGTGLLSAAANAINQYHEVPFDAQMSRTKNRVLVTGLLTPLHAIGFATCATITGISILYFGVNGITAALGAGNLILYTSIYTPMKRFSILNTWVGSIVGSIPPLMGWAGCAGSLDAGAWIFAGLLYAWQFPHFNALSWNLRPDYSRAGYRMMAVTNPGLCRRTALRYTGVITALSLAAPYFEVTNPWFALESLPLNAYFCYLAWKFYKNSDSGSSRKLFRYSLIHLPALMILFLLNKKRWIFSEQKDTLAAAAVPTGTINSMLGTGAVIENLSSKDSEINVIPKRISSQTPLNEQPTSSTSILPVVVHVPQSS